MKKLFALSVAVLLYGNAQAGCVFGAKDKTSFSRLDNHTILLAGGIGSDILLKTYCFIYQSSSVTILKDSFCSYDSAVLYIDDQVCDASQVEKIN